MKKILGIIVLFIGGIVYGQEPAVSHDGFQSSIYLGPMFGDVKAKVTGFENTTLFKGTWMSARIQAGYAYQNWAMGLSAGINSLSWEVMVVEGQSFKAPEDYSVDCSSYGIYLKRYFMPINIFLTTDLGISKFRFYDENADLMGQSDVGFAWNVSAGKEFVIGKKKRFGLGGYVSVSGLKCKDLPPYEKDTYSYITPGLGVVFSYN